MELQDRLRRGNLLYEGADESLNEYEWMIDITDFVQVLFGDIVVKAEVKCMNGFTETEALKGAHTWVYGFEREMKIRPMMSFPGEKLFITFTNGRTVKFQNSDWAKIEI